MTTETILNIQRCKPMVLKQRVMPHWKYLWLKYVLQKTQCCLLQWPKSKTTKKVEEKKNWQRSRFRLMSKDGGCLLWWIRDRTRKIWTSKRVLREVLVSTLVPCSPSIWLNISIVQRGPHGLSSWLLLSLSSAPKCCFSNLLNQIIQPLIVTDTKHRWTPGCS